MIMARAEAVSWRFSAAGLGLSRGREEAQGSSANVYCPTPSQLPHPAPICRPNASTTTDKPAPSYLTCAQMKITSDSQNYYIADNYGFDISSRLFFILVSDRPSYCNK